MSKQTWKMLAIVAVSVAVGFLLGGRSLLPGAQAASEGRTTGVICVVGNAVNQYAPVVLVDVPNQTILVYEYSYQNDKIELTSARTYRFDKMLREFQIKGVTVEEVMRNVQR